MNSYIQDWLDIIENMNNDNTYKLAWGRAIIEIAYSLNAIEDNNVIQFEAIANKMIKYYWNQCFFFGLKQSSNDKKPPILVQEVYKLIDKYKEVTGSTIPVWFDKAEPILYKEKNFYQKSQTKCAKTLAHDVSWRFMNCKKDTKDIYLLNKEALFISLSREQVQLLKDYSFILSQLLNYKWAQLLEGFNNAPRISSKVKGISDAQLKRNSLTKFKNILLEASDNNPLDFYTGETLALNDISIDHVIPWSFMYSDDLWNLVMTSKSNNSSKSNSVPSEEVIQHLKERNQKLLDTISDYKYKHELETAINNDLVDKFYLAIRL